MTRNLFLLLTVALPGALPAQNDSAHVVRGAVRDSAGKPISGVDVFLLSTLEGGATDYILKDNLAKLAPAVERALRQALTDTVQWTLQSEAAAVVIDLVPAAGGETKRLLLAPSATPHRLFVSNLPAENSAHASSHSTHGADMSGLHFGAYYALLMEQPTSMPLPMLSRAAESRKGTSGIRPVHCYPAMFSRQ